MHAFARSWFTLPAPPDSGRDLRDAVRQLIVSHGALKQARRPCGAPLPLAQAYALLELLHAPEPMTVSALAERLTIDRTNVSRLCARMQASGELRMQAHPGDGRARALVLTAKGKSLAQSVDTSSAAHFSGIAETLGAAAGAVIEALELLHSAMVLSEDED